MTPKKLVRNVLARLGDDATLEDIQYEIWFHQKIQEGLDDVKAGRVISSEELEKRLAQWTAKWYGQAGRNKTSKQSATTLRPAGRPRMRRAS